VRDGAGSRALSAGARDHSACVALPIGSSGPSVPIRIQLSYRHVSGSPARICLRQVESRRRARAGPGRAKASVCSLL
jgi:hypothetical protein